MDQIPKPFGLSLFVIIYLIGYYYSEDPRTKLALLISFLSWVYVLLPPELPPPVSPFEDD